MNIKLGPTLGFAPCVFPRCPTPAAVLANGLGHCAAHGAAALNVARGAPPTSARPPWNGRRQRRRTDRAFYFSAR